MHPLGSLEGVAKLLLKHVVIASDDLLREKLFAILRLPSVLKVRPMLAERIGSLRARALWLAPNVEADRAANVSLSSSIRRHLISSSRQLNPLRAIQTTYITRRTVAISNCLTFIQYK